jgi:hypothetical protein
MKLSSDRSSSPAQRPRFVEICHLLAVAFDRLRTAAGEPGNSLAECPEPERPCEPVNRRETA